MSFANAYSAKKKSKMKSGPVISEQASGADSMDEDVVGRAMKKKYSEGGMVANEMGEQADELPAEFDDLALRDGLEFSYTGANSGDERGNEQLNDDEADIVARVMRSLAKKDRNPKPA